MLKKLRFSAIQVIFLASLASASGFDFDGRGAGRVLDIPAAEAPSVSPSAPADRQKEWTIMVYLNGKNNLDLAALSNVDAMEKVGSGAKYNIVVELGLTKSYDPATGTLVNARRYLIKKDNIQNGDSEYLIDSPAVQTLAKADMGDYKHLAEFGRWAKANYPAKKYMLIVWNHGSGWLKSAEGVDDKGISYDDATGHHISTPELGQALKEIGGVDVYASDACMMQMAEVVYELKDSADYITGSEEAEPETGYPYDMVLGRLADRPEMGGAELGQAVVDAYNEYYKQHWGNTTLSVVATSAVKGLVPVVNDFVRAAMAARERRVIKAVIAKTQAFYYNDNKDLWHFLSLYAEASKSPEVKITAKALEDYLSGALIMRNRVSGEKYANSKGLAVFLPPVYFDSTYKELAWARDTQWDEFVKWYR